MANHEGSASAQLQVILKPEPGNPQELYLGSLEALGIDTRAHDVRFVEDNWESPVLGAWGLGWEVWLNGMEITQARAGCHGTALGDASRHAVRGCGRAQDFRQSQPSCLVLCGTSHVFRLRAWVIYGAGNGVTPTARCARVQFTYFQQAGGRPLAVPAVEITYGLERILMSLQVGDQIAQLDPAPC